MSDAYVDDTEVKETKTPILTPTTTTKDAYGVNITSNNKVDLTATLQEVKDLLGKANLDINSFSSLAIENFSRDLIALQESHKSYMDRLTELTVKAPEIDWAERTAVLNQKARADYVNSTMGTVGRMDTIITSPLLDETDPVTTKNILGGS